MRQFNVVLIILVFLPILIMTGCMDGPRDEYTSLCVDVATTARQRQACNCLAYEYGKALTPEEFRTINTMLARSIKELREEDKGNEEPLTVDKKDVDEDVYLGAMKKVALLQRAGICGYTSTRQ